MSARTLTERSVLNERYNRSPRFLKELSLLERRFGRELTEGERVMEDWEEFKT